jgi:tetratricopeptide (TPR) repeat protein
MIVKNEEGNLARLFRSVAGLPAQWIVVDTGSGDGTVAAAKQAGARVLTFPWKDDFSAARNHGLEAAQTPWVLWLDADDELPPETVTGLQALAAGEPDRAYTLVVENPTADRPGPLFRQVRLFPRRREIRFTGKIHESLSPSLRAAGLDLVPSPLVIRHLGYRDPGERERKLQRNFQLLQQERAQGRDDAALWLQLGNSHYQFNRYPEALECYRHIVENPEFQSQQPDVFAAAPSLIGTVYLQMNDRTAAETWFKQDTSPGCTAAYNLGFIALKGGRVAEAERYFKHVLERAGRVSTLATDTTGMKANALGFLGNIAFQKKEYAPAAGYFEQAVREKLPLSFTLLTLAECYIELGKYAETLVLPVPLAEQAEFSRWRGYAFFGLGRAADAEQQFRDYLKTVPDSAPVLSDLAVLRWQAGDTREARELLTRALDLDPQCENAVNNLIDLCFETKELDFLVTALENASRQCPRNIELQQMLVKVREMTQKNPAG